MLDYFENHHAEILELIRRLVEQESMSRQAEATARIAESLGDHLTKEGAVVDLISDPNY